MTYGDLTPEEARTLVDGRDVTATIDPMSYGPAHSFTETQPAERDALYTRVLSYAIRPGASLHIGASGSVIIRYWDENWSSTATVTDTMWHVTVRDFDQILHAALDGGAHIYDHRIRFSYDG